MARDVQSPKASGMSHPGSVRDAGFLASGRGTAQNKSKGGRECPLHGATEGQEQDIYCYTCREKGHMLLKCPKSTGLYCDESSEPRRPVERPTSGEVYRSSRVKGISVADIVLDTGSSRTLVWEDLVPPCAISNGEVAIRCAHGNAISHPLAEIKITVGAHEVLTVQATISKTLPAAVLLGCDVLELMTLLETKTGTQKPTMGDPVLMLHTCQPSRVSLDCPGFCLFVPVSRFSSDCPGNCALVQDSAHYCMMCVILKSIPAMVLHVFYDNKHIVSDSFLRSVKTATRRSFECSTSMETMDSSTS